jgi:hypothetical protein
VFRIFRPKRQNGTQDWPKPHSFEDQRRTFSSIEHKSEGDEGIARQWTAKTLLGLAKIDLTIERGDPDRFGPNAIAARPFLENLWPAHANSSRSKPSVAIAMVEAKLSSNRGNRVALYFLESHGSRSHQREDAHLGASARGVRV